MFIHIPRTGGTALRAHYGWSSYQQHKPIAAHIVDGTDWVDRDTFTIVRNPFDRLVSLCGFEHRERLKRENRRLTAADFTAWLERDRRQPGGAVPILYAGTAFAIHVCAPMVDFVCVEGELMVDQVYHFEGWGGPAWPFDCPRLNESAREKEYRSYYHHDAREIAEDLYRQDLETFNYEF